VPPDRAGAVVGVEVLRQGRGRPGPVVGVGGFLPAQSFDVDGDRGQDVLNMRLGQPAVAAVAGPVSACELCDGALDAGTAGVELAPGGVLLVVAVAFLEQVEPARQEVDGSGLGPRRWWTWPFRSRDRTGACRTGLPCRRPTGIR